MDHMLIRKSRTYSVMDVRTFRSHSFASDLILLVLNSGIVSVIVMQDNIGNPQNGHSLSVGCLK